MAEAARPQDALPARVQRLPLKTESIEMLIFRHGMGQDRPLVLRLANGRRLPCDLLSGAIQHSDL